MFTRILSAAAAGALIVGLTAQPTHAWTTANHREYITFSAPIALPGVVLAAGTYTFEVPNASQPDGLVRVLSRDRLQVYLMQYTRTVTRSKDDSGLRVTFREAAPGAARPIDTWFPRGDDVGRQFIYN